MSWEPIIVAGFALSGVITQAIMSNRKTRRLNTEEHLLGAEERKRAHEAQMQLLKAVHEDVSGLRVDVQQVVVRLDHHIEDEIHHRRAS